ncbi:SIR2 family protein, partial [bacterium]|nr:SIR2 family protein [bacterium]
KINAGVDCAWQKAEDSFGPAELRQRIEPWLTALFQSEHLSLLVGSGLTHAVGGIAECDGLPNMGEVNFEVFKTQIEIASRQTAELAGRKTINFEDQIRVANELLTGLRHYCLSSESCSDDLKKEIKKLEETISEALLELAQSILDGERKLISAPQRENSFGYLVNFLMSPASRSGTRDRLQIFTTNYDRLIEAGAEVAGLHLIDRFVGSLAPIFRSSRLNLDMHYNPPGIRGEPRYLEGVVRFSKLHGSVDWIYSDHDIRRIGLPFGADDINPFLKAPGLHGAEPLNMMIYPNSSKDRETTAYPYVDLFRDFAAAICRPNSTLVTYGYSFGDEHINRVIEDMLTIPSTHLVIISYDDPMGRIMKTYEKVARKAQTTLLIGNHLGNLKTLVDHYMPKPAIDRTTFRMAELLKSRFGIFEVEGKKDEESEEE